MPHVSRKPVKKDVYIQIVDSLMWLLADIKSQEQMKAFFDDFFTKTEKTMLAKRLAIAVLINQGYDTEIIKQVLNVSTGTVYRIREWVSRGSKGLHLGLNKLAHQEKMLKFWKKVDKILEEFVSKPSILPRLPKN